MLLREASSSLRMSARDSTSAAIMAAIWGFNFVVIDWGMKGVPPLLFAAIRFGFVLLPAAFFIPRPAVPWRTLIGVGLFMSLGQFALLYSSMHVGMPPGLAALVLSSQALLTIVIAAVTLRERPTMTQATGVVVGTVGVAVVAIGRGGDVTVLALTLCLLAALSWAIGNVISRRAGVPGGLPITVWSSVVVPVPLLALSLALDGPTAVGEAVSALTWRAGISTAYTAGLASIVGYTVFNRLLGRYQAASVVPWVLLAPVVAITAAWLCLGQQPNLAESIGGSVMLGGILITLRTPPRVRRDGGRVVRQRSVSR